MPPSRLLLTDDEEVLRDFHAHWRVLLPPIGIAILAFAAAGVISAVAGDVMIGSWRFGTVAWVVALLVSIVAAIRPIVRWLYSRYTLTTERIIVRSGIIARRGNEIPLENIVNVQSSQRAYERLLGYGDILLESAGATGQSRLTDIPDPEEFQSQIYAARERRTLMLQAGDRGPAAPRDVAAQLQTLADLHDAGKLSNDDFERQKRRLLDG
jgi:uncharacterized membrane protein YdbT with pleckstrin-like domain